MATYPALALNPSTFNPAGVLQSAIGIQGQQTQNALREFQLREARERNEALTRFGNAGGIGSPGALGELSRFPDLYTQAISGMNNQQQLFAHLNARAAQRVLLHPEGSSERATAYRQELERARQERRIDDNTYQNMINRPPTDMLLNEFINLATPLTGGLNQRQIMSLFGFGPGGEDQRRPPTTGGAGAGELIDRNVDALNAVSDRLNFEPPPDTGGGPGAAATLDAFSGAFAPPPPTRNILGPLWDAARRPGPPRLGPRWGLGDIMRGRSIADPEFQMSPPPTTGPSGAPGGLTLPIDPVRLAELTRGQTGAPPPAPVGSAFADDAFLNAASQQFAGTGTRQPPAAGTTPPPTTGGTGTGGLAGLRGAIAGMSREQRLAAMLYMMKGDYGEMAKLILGQTAGTEALDRAYAPEFASWTAAGGYADIQRQIAQLAGVERNLASGATLTGGITGSLPDFVNRFINPSAIANRDRVREVVQRSLRQILGPQFTAQEAEALMARAYDQTQPQAENLRRVRALLLQIAAGAESRQSAANYFQRFGTLRGWQGRMLTLGDFNALFDDSTTGTTTGTGGDGFTVRRLD